MFIFWLSFTGDAAPKTHSGFNGRQIENAIMQQNYYFRSTSVNLAWESEKGNRLVKVGVIDAGVEADHPFLKGSIRGGYDYIGRTDTLIGAEDHGNHIIGIIKSIADVSLYSYRFYSKNANQKNVANNLIQSIYKAIDDGCQIINISAGGYHNFSLEYEALKYAKKKNVLVIVAAGNDHWDIDSPQAEFFPAEYELSNILVVASVDQNDELTDTSNWGRLKVDIAAPGDKLINAFSDHDIGIMSGTSQATAVVSGIAALMYSKNPHLKPQEYKKILMETVDRNPSLQNKIRSNGRVNAWKALSRVPKLSLRKKS